MADQPIKREDEMRKEIQSHGPRNVVALENDWETIPRERREERTVPQEEGREVNGIQYDSDILGVLSCSSLNRTDADLAFIDHSFSTSGIEEWHNFENEMFSEWDSVKPGLSSKKIRNEYHKTCQETWPWSPAFRFGSEQALSPGAAEYAAHYALSCSHNQQVSDLVTKLNEYHILDAGFDFENKIGLLAAYASENHHMFVSATQDESLHLWCTALRDSDKKQRLTRDQIMKLTRAKFDFNSRNECSFRVFLVYYEAFVREVDKWGAPVSSATTQWFLDMAKAFPSEMIHPAMEDVLRKCPQFISLSGVYAVDDLNATLRQSGLVRAIPSPPSTE